MVSELCTNIDELFIEIKYLISMIVLLSPKNILLLHF